MTSHNLDMLRFPTLQTRSLYVEYERRYSHLKFTYIQDHFISLYTRPFKIYLYTRPFKIYLYTRPFEIYLYTRPIALLCVTGNFCVTSNAVTAFAYFLNQSKSIKNRGGGGVSQSKSSIFCYNI